MLSRVIRAAVPAVRPVGVTVSTPLRCLATEASVTFPVPDAYLIDPLEDDTTTATKDEVLEWYHQMWTIRRMEILCDTEYKSRSIRGFCHLYDGQEAVAVGIEGAVEKTDNIITTYRCHGLQYVRGMDVSKIFAEMFGFKEGVAKGKGGSMHLYSKELRFWGGAGIVGAQVPVGTGIAFSDKYNHKGDGRMPVTVTMYGDGAANQGQCWEAANMAKLWGLPVIYVCENNKYGMGTSVERSSAVTEYYKYGKTVIPGLRCNGMDVFSVRETMRKAVEYAGSGNGPIFVEMNTYRYHGHSMSDPGITYRARDEVKSVRKDTDPIDTLRRYILAAELADEDELKVIEKAAKKGAEAELAIAKQGSLPPLEELYTDVYFEDGPRYVRGAESTLSKVM